jgi:DNA repair protein RecO (recombination protein O)
MSIITTEAVILRARDLKEADKIITLYTKKHGKVQVVAKGLRKIKSKLASSVEMFNFTEVSLYMKDNRNLSTLTGASLKRSLYKLRHDIVKISSASLVVELVDKLIKENQPNVKIYNFLESVLTMMEEDGTDSHLLTLFFMVHLFSLLGYKLHLKSCVSCDSSDYNSARFSSLEGGIICPSCYFRDYRALEVSRESLVYLRKLQLTGLSKINSISVPLAVRKDLERVLDFYLGSHLPWKLNTRKFMEKLEMTPL